MRHIRRLHRPFYAWVLALILLAGIWTAYAVQVGQIRDRAFEEAGVKAQAITAAFGRFVSGNLGRNGQLAVEAAAAQRFDIVLMDLQMPLMNGLDAARAIHGFTAAASEAPIIALTANAFADDIAACPQAGMNDFLPKPLDFDLPAVALDRWSEAVPAEL